MLKKYAIALGLAVPLAGCVADHIIMKNYLAKDGFEYPVRPENFSMDTCTILGLFGGLTAYKLAKRS